MALYRHLTNQDADTLIASLDGARRLPRCEEELTAAHLQSVYDMLLARPDKTEVVVRSLGFAFGSLLTRHEWLRWAMLVDAERGDEFAVIVQGRELGCSPITMVQYRLEDGEQCDLAALAEETISHLRRLGQQAAST